MAFTSSITDRTVFGDKRVVFGSYTSGATAVGGTLAHGLKKVYHIDFTSAGTATTETINPQITQDLQGGFVGPTVGLTTGTAASGTFISYGL